MEKFKVICGHYKVEQSFFGENNNILAFFLYFRVFKKGSPNGKITVYLGRRDFVDHVSHVDPIDGVVLVDPEYLNGRKVFGHVLAAFRYGREDLDVLGKIMNNFIDML